MFFKQVLYRDLGCASYVLGDAGEAIVVDPRWDVDVYLEVAKAERLRIAYVLDTHDHADHVSGRRRLARLTGARSFRAALPGERREDGIEPGGEIAVGALRVRALPTPGHRPEHIAFEVIDLTRGSDPWMLLTGDSLLVGDIARPDLVLEADEGATMMYSSLRALVELGDHLEVWPGHVGGSLCGGADLSRKTSSTVGFERRHNPLLLMNEYEFVRGFTGSLPPRPANVDRIVEINRSDIPEPEPIQRLAGGRVSETLRRGVTVLDARNPVLFDEGHLDEALNLTVSSDGVGTRAGWSVGPDESILIAADEEDAAHSMAIALQSVGLWQIAGYTVGDGTVWEQDGLPVTKSRSWDLEQLVSGLRRDAVELVDVRDPHEWIAGHVPGSHHLPLDQLADGATAGLPANGRTTAVACTSGSRAAFAASLLRRRGLADVVRIADGGIPDLEQHGIDLAVGA